MIYQLHASLKWSPIKIWRRFLCESDTTLTKLMKDLLVMFNMDGSHLYSISTRDNSMRFTPSKMLDSDSRDLNADKYKISDVLVNVKDKINFEYSVYVCKCDKQCGPYDVPMLVNGECQCVYDPLVVDFDKDGEVEAALDCGVDLTGVGNIHLCATKGDKMLAINELNTSNEIDRTKIFSTETIDPFFNNQKLNAPNGFEALYYLAISSVIFADDKFIRGEANTEANEYAYITGSKKTNYNNYDLIINLIDRAGNESKGKVNIDLSNIEDEQILLKVADIDSDYKEYNYISDNENDVWEYCQSN